MTDSSLLDEIPLDPNPIISEAITRWRRARDWEAQARQHFVDDLKFDAADSDNFYQWPDQLTQLTPTDYKPRLTINKTRQHNLQIINDAKQNKPGIAIRPTGNGATFEAAQALESVVRYIERQSRATQAYDTATGFQVRAGIGYIRVATDFANADNMDQDIFIRRVPDPLTIYIDPDAREADKSDMAFAFVYEDMAKKDFKEAYPKYTQYASQTPLGNDAGADWVKQDHIRVCEYWRRVKVSSDKLVVAQGPNGPTVMKASRMEKEKLKLAIDDPQTRLREISNTKVEWYLIIGNQIAERKEWPGKYIPIVPVIGEETVIDGVMDRKGHTRAMKDPQRMYNYWTSSAVEHVALQGKTPYLASAQAIEGYETYWNTANSENYSVLPYNGIDDQGQKIDMPQRAQAPQMAPAYIQGMQIASDELMAVSGQYQAMMGAPGNERSAKAINERERQGDNSTYHFIDNLAIAVRQVGRIIMDLFPKIYDTRRVMMIMAEDGSDFEVTIDPEAKKAYEEKVNYDNQVAQRVLNPSVGQYEVEAEVGPNYSTKREEAFNAFTLILTQAPQLTSLIGDLLLKAGDFPMADEAAARLKRMVPPHALGQGPSQNEQTLMQQVDQLKALLTQSLQELATAKLQLKGKDQLRDIDAYEAVTKRLAAEGTIMKDTGQLAISAAELHKLTKDTLEEGEGIGLEPAVAASAPTLDAAAQGGQGNSTAQLQLGFMNRPPVPGARKGPNGQWYAPDPTRSGRYVPIA